MVATRAKIEEMEGIGVDKIPDGVAFGREFGRMVVTIAGVLCPVRADGCSVG